MKNYKSQMKYRKKNIKQRVIDFGIDEWSLYDFSKTINFTRFIKDMLIEFRNDAEIMSKYVK